MEPISELNDTNIKQICRTCLTINIQEMLSIFDEIEQGENEENVKMYICDMLMDVALIELATKESLPTLICINCLRLAQNLFNFRKQCNRSQAILLEYLKEKENKVKETLGTEKSPNQDSNVLNKKSAIKEWIDIEKSLIEYEHESRMIENEVCVLSNHSSSDVLLNSSIKLEFDDEIIESDTEHGTEKKDKLIGILSIAKSPKQERQYAIKELIDTEKTLNEIKHESVTIKNEVHELSNPASSDNLLNSVVKLDCQDDIMKSNTESECEETLHCKLFNCQLCDKSFKTDTFYFAHMKRHKEGKYVCNICSKHFKYRGNLTNHMKQHSEDKCVCKVCNKHFKCAKYLASHLLTHGDEKRYSCKICCKQYKQPSSLIVHMRMHNGQTPFLCSFCGKRFRDATSHKSHMTTHTKEKPYMCNICGKTTSRKCYLTEHMKTHSDDTSFKCTECGKVFSAAKHLKRHLFIHTGLKPFSCDVCKKSFNRQSNLRLHAKIHERPHRWQL